MENAPKITSRPEWREVSIWRDLESPPITPDGNYWIIPEH